MFKSNHSNNAQCTCGHNKSLHAFRNVKVEGYSDQYPILECCVEKCKCVQYEEVAEEVGNPKPNWAMWDEGLCDAEGMPYDE